MRFRPIVGTLAYLWDRTEDRVLMISRDARPDDDHFGKVNGLGGKLEQDESAVACIRREIQEEAELELTSFSLRGTITWSNFGPNREQWLAFVFLVDGWTGTPPPSNEEGTLIWVPRQRLLAACGVTDSDQIPDPKSQNPKSQNPEGPDEHQPALSMWEGDRSFIPMVFDDDPRTFHGTMPYEGDKPLSWDFERL